MPKVLSVKIKEKGSKGPACYEYKNEVEFTDFNKLAIFFLDLEVYGGNIEKAFRKYQEQKEEGFPW